MPRSDDLSYCATEVRRMDNDRFLTALFAAAAEREALFALYAFNIEIAKTRETVSEPLIGQIRLQWWRDAIDEIFGDGPVRRHAVVQPLAAAAHRYALLRGDLDALVDAREQDLDDRPFATMQDLESYAMRTTAPLARLALRILGVEPGSQEDVYRSAAAAYALVGLVRALPFRLGQDRHVLPETLMSAHGIDGRALMAGQPVPGLTAAVAAMTAPARRHLAKVSAGAAECPRLAAPVMLQASLARSYLARLKSAGFDPFDRRMARRTALLPAMLWCRAALRRY